MVAGLIVKRQEIAVQIESLQRQVKTATTAPDRVEATMRIFKPDLDLSQFPARPVPPAHSAFKGEITRIVFAALRGAPEPLTARDLAVIVMREQGLPLNDLKLARVTQSRRTASARPAFSLSNREFQGRPTWREFLSLGMFAGAGC
ncbi:MAG: hypothetical protein WB709_11905 [Solirubrobacteraceae bacterium]